MADLGDLANRMASSATPADTGTAGGRRPPPRRSGAKPDTAGPESTQPATEPPAAAAEPDSTPEPKAERQEETPAREVVSTASRTTAMSTVEPAAAIMAAKQEAGSVVQVRVQPPDVGVWFNQLLEAGAYAFDGRAGDIAGAIMLVAQAHEDEIIEVLERWGGEPDGFLRKAVWDAYLKDRDERQPRVVDGS